MEEDEEEGGKARPLRQMSDAGKLHIDEEFRKSKRNLVWFCSFAVVLSAVYSKGGAINPPVLGGSVSIEIGLLRFFVWLGCLYTLIGFFRQARDIDLVNSELVYAAQFKDIRQNLYEVEKALAEIGSRLKGAIRSGPSWYSLPYDIPTAQERIKQALRPLGEAIAQIAKEPGPRPREELLSGWHSAQRNFIEVLAGEMGEVAKSADYNHDQLKVLSETVEKLEFALKGLQGLPRNFKKLSQQIRSDHRILYLWYDKYLAYTMFAVASGLTFWRILVP